MEKLPPQTLTTLISIANGSNVESDVTSIRKLFSEEYIRFSYKIGWVPTYKGKEYLITIGLLNKSAPQRLRKIKALN
jgi:hypothetical protein